MWANIEPTTWTVFHNPNDSTSQRVLNALKAAVIEYPAQRPNEKVSDNYPSKQLRGPLKLELTVLKRPPSAEEFRLLLPLQPQSFFTEFLHPEEREAPTNSALVELLARRPTALRWPVVVDWEHDEYSVGGDGYKELLKKVGKRRQKVTKPELKAASPPPPPPPPPAEWIDYD